MNKIPTAEEFIKDVIEVPFRHTKIVEADVAKEKLIQFAKMHVKAALQSAADQYNLKDFDNRDTILHSYHLNNIK